MNPSDEAQFTPEHFDRLMDIVFQYGGSPELIYRKCGCILNFVSNKYWYCDEHKRPPW